MTNQTILFRFLFSITVLGTVESAAAQPCAPTRSGRVAALTGGFVAGQTLALVVRHRDWWTTPATGLHFTWDRSANREQDGLLHAALGYHTTRLAMLAWDWTCVRPATAAWLGALTGIAAGLPKEIGDGIHRDKGFSTRDFAWTVGGAILPALHRTTPATRAVRLKVWYWPSTEFRNRGPGGLPTLENDYAGQRYVLAIHPHAAWSPWPRWVGVGLGHGIAHWISAPPEHEWYVALDLALPGVPVLGPLFDAIHLPLPGLRVSGGSVQFGLY